ncbi:MAG: hypothetical protein R6V85_09660 [Polyangia bacterium]
MTGGAENPSATADSGGSRHRGLAALVFVAGAVALGVLVYFLAGGGRGAVPSMPRAELSESAVAESLNALERRASSIEPSDDDRGLLSLLEDLHASETAERVGPDTARRIEELLRVIREEAQSALARDREGYLALGDRQAWLFHSAMLDVLEAARGRGLESVGAERRSRLVRLGGAFFQRALDRGLVTEDGELNGPDHLPSVLFRVRWRMLAGMDAHADLEPVEIAAHLDFVAAFAPPAEVERRLEAIEKLAERDESYDAVLARAVALTEGGRVSEAYDLLRAARENGRKDEALLGLLRHLAP